MIRYSASARAILEGMIDSHNSTWRTNADARTAALVAAGRFVEESSIWGAIKPVFMTLQHRKCVFCERPLGGREVGTGEHDVEHFRPKSKVRPWPYASRKPKLTYDFATGAKSDTGYYWLAYDFANYAAACKPCNTSRKSDYFPIAGARGGTGLSIRDLNAQEKPLLLFPLGDDGDDPSEFITFDGVLAVPKDAAGPNYLRARVTIDFFSLNDREELWEERFRVIKELFWALQASRTETDPERRSAAQRAVDEAVSDRGSQALCARSFLAVAKTDPQKAWGIYELAEQYLANTRASFAPPN